MQTMQAAKATPGILKMCGSQKLLDQLTECNKLLESVQKVHSPLAAAKLCQCAMHRDSLKSLMSNICGHQQQPGNQSLPGSLATNTIAGVNVDTDNTDVH